MSGYLLPTKFFAPPLRPSVVARPELVARLDRGRHSRLTLVTAPAGFGKTTLVTAWIAQQANPGRVAWLSLDEHDDEPVRFFTYFVAALRQLEPSFAADLFTSLRLPTPPQGESLLAALLHELVALTRPICLILDDYHVINSAEIHTSMVQLIDYLPPNLRLVITSRVEPPLPLARWRARGQLTEIWAADLRFNPTEVGHFLRETMGLTLADDAIRDLDARTEGWPAGLQLAALSLRSEAPAARSAVVARVIAGFGGAHRHVAEYLLSEVFARQTPDVRRFLLFTSILDRFNEALCRAVVHPTRAVEAGPATNPNDAAPQAGSPIGAQPRSTSILSTLEQANLFLIPLDSARQWYRYHQLFGDWLRDTLAREAEPSTVRALHRRAARWLAARQLVEEALMHAVQGDEMTLAAALLADIPTAQLWQTGLNSTLRSWGARIPAAALRAQPRAIIALCAVNLIAGQIQATRVYLAQAETIEEVRGEFALLKGILLRNQGHFKAALASTQEAGEFLPEDDTALRATAFIQLANIALRLGELDEADAMLAQARSLLRPDEQGALTIVLSAIQLQGLAAASRGELETARRLYEAGIAAASEAPGGPTPLVGVMYAGLGDLAYERNRLDEARAAYAEVRRWADRSGISDLRFAAALGEMSLHRFGSDETTLDAQIEALRAATRQASLSDVSIQLEALFAAHLLRVGRLREAVAWANGSGARLTDRAPIHERHLYQTLAAVRLAEGTQTQDAPLVEAVEALLDHLLRQVRAKQLVVAEILLLALRSLAFEQLDRPTDADAALSAALALAAPRGIMRPLLDCGPALARPLARQPNPYAARLLHALRADQHASDRPVQTDTLVLTPRELDVLRAIAAGLSNKEIEAKLVISRNTVRTHIKNLYAKLEVTSRTQAIRRARELALL